MDCVARCILGVTFVGIGCDYSDLEMPPPPMSTTGGVPFASPQGGIAPGDGFVPPPATTTTTATTGTDGGFDLTGGDIVTIPTGIVEVCISTCECPPATICRGGRCEPSADIVYCCTDPLCPAGEPCETLEGTLEICR